MYVSKILIRIENHNQYNSSASVEYMPDGRAFEMSYGLGRVSGFTSNDTVRVSWLWNEAK